MDHTRITMQALEINVTYACNLKCEYCTHLGKYLQGIVPLEEIVSWYKAWYEKVHPDWITLLGGEPLLHPNLAGILYTTKEHWSDSKTQMVTNGLLLEAVSEDVVEALRKTNFLVSISKHSTRPEFDQKISRGIQLLEEHGIRYEVRPSHTWWVKSYRLDKSCGVYPHYCDPERAWKSCYIKGLCMTLMDGMIFKCPQIACFRRAYHIGFLSEDWSFLCEYVPLSPDASNEEITSFLRKQAESACCLCPEVFEFATAEEKLPLWV